MSIPVKHIPVHSFTLNKCNLSSCGLREILLLQAATARQTKHLLIFFSNADPIIIIVIDFILSVGVICMCDRDMNVCECEREICVGWAVVGS